MPLVSQICTYPFSWPGHCTCFSSILLMNFEIPLLQTFHVCWRMGQHIPPKHVTLTRLYGVRTQKTTVFECFFECELFLRKSECVLCELWLGFVLLTAAGHTVLLLTCNCEVDCMSVCCFRSPVLAACLNWIFGCWICNLSMVESCCWLLLSTRRWLLSCTTHMVSVAATLHIFGV